MMTTHKNPQKAERTASAPYNFIPLPDEVILAGEGDNGFDALHPHHQHDQDRLDGYFEVVLETKSPTFVRGMLDERAFKEDDSKKSFSEKKKNKPDFFTNPSSNAPIIPGSSLRGMLRQIVEIISYSRLKQFTDSRLIYRAVGDTTNFGAQYRERFTGENKGDRSIEWDYDYPSGYVKGGYLEIIDGKPTIIPAKTDQYNQTFVHVEYRDAEPVIRGQGRWRQHNVWVKPVAITASYRGKRSGKYLTLNTDRISARVANQPQPIGLEAAVLIESGHMGGGQHPKHWHCAIYEKDPSQSPISIPDEMWETYQTDRDMTRGIQTRELGKNNQTALFYLLDDQGELVYFGSTKMFRLPYKNKIADCIPKSNPIDVDFADALFGFIRNPKDFNTDDIPKQGDPKRGYASRISVTDAILEPKQTNVLHDGVLVPSILASPKPTSFQLYLNQPEPDDKRELYHYDSDGATIRGFKMYWHQGNPSIRSLEAPKNETQSTQMRPVKAGVKFRFKVHFTQLTKVELGALAWALQPKTPDDQEIYCHKIGMGKPLGMGSVFLTSGLYIQDPKTRYSSLFKNHEWATGLQKKALSTYIEEFEEEMLFQLYFKDGNLYDVKRIAQLLAIMKFSDHPKRSDLKNQEIKDFRERRVLPDQGGLVKLSGYRIPNFKDE